MNRTAAFLGLAGIMGLLAAAVGLPRSGSNPVAVVDPPQPAVTSNGSIKMVARLSHPYLGVGAQDVFATVDLQGEQVPGAERSPVNLALVIDRSGSMAGEKLRQAKNAARRLVEQLRDADRIALVHFGSEVRTFSGRYATAPNKAQLLSYIDQITDEGGTNIGDGLMAGKTQVLQAQSQFKVNRIILLSDGEPTEGLTSTDALEEEARSIRSEGVTISAIGLGTDFNEDLMQALAEMGSGAYAYLHDATQLGAIFQRELQQASATVARDVLLTFELPEGVRLGDVLGYRSEISGNTVSIPMSDFSSGQVERVVVRLSVDAKAAGRSIDVSGVRLSYNDVLKGAPAGAVGRLSAMVTERREEIAAHQDKDATVYAARAMSAANTNKAAEFLRRGDRVGAKQLLEANQQLFQGAAATAGAPAVARDMEEQREAIQRFDSASSADEVMHQVKEAKKRARTAAGKIGSTY